MLRIYNHLVNKLRSEPPFAAAFVTIFVFTIPVFITILLRGVIQLPPGYTSRLEVAPIYGFAALAINIVLLFVFGTAPVFSTAFQTILAPDYIRKLMIYAYLLLTFISLYIINAKLDLINSLLEDPIVTMLKVGGELGDDNLLRYYFYGISGCVSFALVNKDDSFLLRALVFTSMIAILLFYFFIGRREICIMVLCFIFLLKREKINTTYLALIGIIVAAIIIFILSIRSGDDGSPMFSTNSEELSSVAYSAYVIQHTTPDILHSFQEATIIRAYTIPSDISEAFVKADSGYSDPGAIVLGIAGVTYMYGFIIPLLSVFIFGSFFRTINMEFKKKKAPILKLLLIFVVFRAFNLFRNGEFPVVTLDTIKFFLLISPAVFLKFNDNKILKSDNTNLSR